MDVEVIFGMIKGGPRRHCETDRRLVPTSAYCTDISRGHMIMSTTSDSVKIPENGDHPLRDTNSDLIQPS